MLRELSSSCRRRVLAAAACLMLGGGIAAAAEKAAFNYPLPPKEGAADYFTIAENGQARCVIVFDPRGARDAAVLLKTYLDLATGAAFEVAAESKPVPEGFGVIHCGDTQRALQMPLDIPDAQYASSHFKNINGYLIQTPDAKTLIIRGVTVPAVKLGVVGFLKRYVGVRHCWAGNPGDIGDVVPKCPTLRIPQIEWRDWPYFISRNMSGITQFGAPRDGPYKAVDSSAFFRLNYTIPSNESYYKWLPPEKYAETHPEYYPLVNGKRYVPKKDAKSKYIDGGWQPCVSNPEVVQIMAGALLDHFRKHPDDIAINLAVNDGQGDCMCDQCKAMDAPHADYANRIGLSDRYIAFSNQVAERVAKEFPDKLIAFIAYGSMTRPPVQTPLYPTLMPVLTMVGQNAFLQWDEWMKVAPKHMGAYLYHDDQSFFIMPKMDFHQSAKRIRYFVDSGTPRHFYQEMYPFWPLDAMVTTIENEMLWDPRQDVDAILNEFYTKFFGPAAEAMKGFYTACEAGYDRWVEETGQAHPYGKDVGALAGGRDYSQFQVLNPPEADRADACLTKAAEQAAGDPVVSQRIDLVRRLFGFAALGARQYWPMARLNSMTIASDADLERMLADARAAVSFRLAMGEYKRDVMQKPPANSYAPFVSVNTFCNEIHPGEVAPQILEALSRAFDAANVYLRNSVGPEKAKVWWHARRAAEKDPFVADACELAEIKAAGVQLANLVQDPGYETRGAGSAVPPGTSPAPDFQTHNGVYLWSRPGTPVNFSLTTEQAHTGKYSAMFTDSTIACTSAAVSAQPGERFHLSVWIMHNDLSGTYTVQVMPNGDKGVEIPRVVLPVTIKPGVWQEVTLDFTAPAETRQFALCVFAMAQTPGAKLWIDDMFISKYPPLNP